MSKPDLRAIVEVKLDFITQAIPKDDYDCHQTDEWKLHQRGAQDCLLDRIHLCGNKLGGFGNFSNWDFTSCLFMNQLATFQVNDQMRGFNATVQYCSYLWNLDVAAVTECAYSGIGRSLLQASHAKEVAHNPNSPHIGWILVNDINHMNDEDADWGKLVCDAYNGPRPTSCQEEKGATTLYS